MPPPIMPNPTTTTTTSSSSSSFRGVRKRRWGSWVAEIREPRTRSRIWLGSYPSASAAARAFDAAAFCLRGPSARLNLPHLLLNLPLSLLPSPPAPASRLSPNSIRRVAHAHATSTANSYNGGSLTNGIHVDGELCTPSMSQESVDPGKSSQPPVRSSRLMINQEDPDDPPERIESPFRSSQPLIDEHSIDPPEESQLADSSEDNQDSPRSCDIIKISPPNPAIRPQKSSEIRRCQQTATISARRKLSVPDVRCPAVGPSDTAGSRGELGDHDVASSGWLARASLEISPSPTFEQIVAAMAPDAPHHPGHEGSEPGDCADVAPSESLSLWNYW